MADFSPHLAGGSSVKVRSPMAGVTSPLLVSPDGFLAGGGGVQSPETTSRGGAGAGGRSLDGTSVAGSVSMSDIGMAALVPGDKVRMCRFCLLPLRFGHFYPINGGSAIFDQAFFFRGYAFNPVPCHENHVHQMKNFFVFEKVLLKGSFPRRAVIRYIGETQFASGIWVGVELSPSESRQGNNDGSVNGVPYFRCPHERGIFLRPNMVETEDAMNEVVSGADVENREQILDRGGEAG